MSFSRLWVSLLLLSVSAASARGQSPESPETRVPPELQSRWRSLPPEEQERVRKRFQRFQQMSAEERAALRDRHHSLEKARKEVLGTLSAQQIERLERLPTEERERAMRPYVAEFLEQSRKSVLASAGLPEPARGQRNFRDIRRAVAARAEATLREFEEDGDLEPGQAERLMALSPWELRLELAAIQKRHFLQNPPRQFLMLPEAKRDELIQLPAEDFLRKLRDLRGAPPRRPDRLPPLMEDALLGRPRSPRPVPERAIFEALAPEQRQAASKLEGRERTRLIERYLRKNAARVLEAQGRDPAHLQRLTKNLSPVERTRRLLRIIGARHPPGGAGRPHRPVEPGERPRKRTL